ncbi:MAG: hypothetical protein ACREAC_14080, partial [Blastocatellia bacterium]
YHSRAADVISCLITRTSCCWRGAAVVGDLLRHRVIHENRLIFDDSDIPYIPTLLAARASYLRAVESNAMLGLSLANNALNGLPLIIEEKVYILPFVYIFARNGKEHGTTRRQPGIRPNIDPAWSRFLGTCFSGRRSLF